MRHQNIVIIAGVIVLLSTPAYADKIVAPLLSNNALLVYAPDKGHEHEGGHDHDEHGHDDEHGHGHGRYEEGKTEITPEAAENAGIVIEKAASARIGRVIPLTGRITVNQNAKANVRVRYPGIVRAVKVNLGETVEKGQVLAVVESNAGLKEYDITSPIDGVVLERNTNLGDIASDGVLFTIADLSRIWAKFHVFPKDAEMVKSGQSMRIYTVDKTKEGAATIEMLFPTADAFSQTLIAIAPMPGENGLWRPGMTVAGEVTVSEHLVDLAVRASALQTIENQTVVFVKEGDTYEQKSVQTGMNDGEYVEIKSGLKEGQEYVSQGSFIVKADILKSGAEHHH